MYAPDVLESFQRLIATGRVEVLADTYHHSLAFFYSVPEFKRQVKQHERRVKQIFGVIEEINREQRMTVFLVEQNAFHALKLAHRGYVMVTGTITMSGTGRELLANEEVRAAYLEGGH